MQTVSVILFLVLASTNASNYLHPLPHYQQEPDEPLTLEDGYNDDSFELFYPQRAPDSVEGWTSGTDPRTAILQELLTSTRFIKPDEFRSKRTEASLSIVNALDVLRQRLILELARRKMNESKAQIEKNRLLFEKTGKRSQRNYEDALREFLLRKRMQREEAAGKPLPGSSRKESEDTATTKRNLEIDPGFQT